MRIAVHHAALACCALEVSTAIALDLPASVAGHELQAGGDGDISVLVVAGTVSKSAAPSLAATWQQLPEPRIAIAYGVCASSGGPYWDSYSVLPGAESLLPISRFVPGCPPPRQTLVDAIIAAVDGAA
ncbi:MAG: hypothetical protein RIS43_442 [Actinomycetota bacterium]|jgi:NADH-quinone oxidoreductase subunit B